MNPKWNETNKRPDFQFKKAMELVGEDFTDQLKYFYDFWLPAREFVQKSVETRKEVVFLYLCFLFSFFYY